MVAGELAEMAGGEGGNSGNGGDGHRGRIEVVATVLLAVAAVLTAWTTFESTKWGGVQADSYSRGGALRTESTRFATFAGQQAQVDIALFMGWLTAATAVFVLAAPGAAQRLVIAFWDAIPSDPIRRAVGAVNLAFGLVLGWVAFVAFLHPCHSETGTTLQAHGSGNSRLSGQQLCGFATSLQSVFGASHLRQVECECR